MDTVKKDLGQILRDEGLITPEKLENARQLAASSRKSLMKVILQEKLVSPESLSSAFSLQLGIPIADLGRVEIQPQAVALVPEHIAREHSLVPLYLDGDTLTVGMENPEDIRAIDILTTLTRKRIEVVIPYKMSVADAINSSYRLTSRIQQQAGLFGKADPAAAKTAQRAEIAAMAAEDMTSQAPIVQTVSMLLTQAVQDRGSDIHFDPQKDRLKVRFRIDGVLHEVVSLPLTAHQGILTRIKVMGNMNIAERRRPQDGQFTYTVNGKQVDFRVCTAETNYGEMAVLRVLDRSLALMQLSELGMRPELIAAYTKLLQAPFGMILVSGPTGVGKTTSLYASVTMLDSKQQNIMTIEDPVEYRFDNISQMQVNRQADITFASGL
ncbi:MAG: ATPase, T2SS/T4P/T4SS family, partial [Chloroflexi bacterium]|nr:ATPase, T2SS/T4P/T4SS family [Chloroflexota bacterium]